MLGEHDLLGPLEGMGVLIVGGNFGMVGGLAAAAIANHERLRLRVDALEQRLAQCELSARGARRGTESLWTLRWKEMDSKFQYAGTVNL